MNYVANCSLAKAPVAQTGLYLTTLYAVRWIMTLVVRCKNLKFRFHASHRLFM